jgi:elongator complex protein 3
MALAENTASKDYIESRDNENGSNTKLRKPTKTISGVAPLTVVLPFRPCDHGTCTFCPTHHGAPQSYTPLSPAVMRARLLNFSPSKQVIARLKAFTKMGHPTDKIEIIILGGTFLQYPSEFKYQFIKACYDSLNGLPSKDLQEAKKINETASNRCVALCIETRPDNCTESEIKEMLDYGCTRVEIGVQMPSDKIYKLVNRGHTVKEVVDATRMLKDSGFKIGYHIMPGLPGSTPEQDLEMFDTIFSSDDFKPDQLKLYPCQVIKGAELEKDYNAGLYKPYSEEETRDILVKMVSRVPEYCRVMRMMRELPPVYVVAGIKRIDLRNEVEKELRKGSNSGEIRLREIGFSQTTDYDFQLKTLEYGASGGKEFFLSAVNEKNVLFGLLRLRFPSKTFIKDIASCAIIRELHVYGKALKLTDKSDSESDNIAQHSGLGKALMLKAEELAKSKGFEKIAVISGVGVREYYRRMGYELKGNYMVKNL